MNETNANTEKLNSAQNDAGNSEGSVPAESSLDKVRDILFGEQTKEFQNEFSFLKNQQENLFANLKDDFVRRLETMSRDMERMRKELDKEALDSTLVVNKQLDHINQSLAELDTRSTELNTQMEAWRVDLLSELDQVNSQLAGGKVDRSTMADLLSEMSSQLMKD